jgi:hypothetical protein
VRKEIKIGKGYDDMGIVLFCLCFPKHHRAKGVCVSDKEEK